MLIWLAILPVLVHCASNHKNISVEELIQLHLKNHAQMQVQDVYKLFYQGNFGPAHILQHQEHAKKYLVEEFRSVEASDSESLTEPISTDGKMIRVNFAAFKHADGNIEALWQTLVKSAELVKPDTARFRKDWNEFVELANQKTFSFPQKDIELFDKKVHESQFPTVHHTEAYRQTNHPAYRVVLREVFEKKCKLRRSL